MNLFERAEAWIAADPEPEDRRLLAELLAAAAAGDSSAQTALADRFSGPLEFGTAGLRGVVGAGESRMNLAVVLRATFGLVQHVLRVVPDAKRRGIVIGGDARPTSHALARAASEVAAAQGLRVHYFPGTSPTPLVAYSVKALGAAAGVTVTASHNPPEYNGYKVYLDRGSQIVPPHDAEIAQEIQRAPLAKDVPRLALEEGLARGLIVDATRHEEDYLRAVLSLKTLEVPAASLRIAYTALHGVGERFIQTVMARAGFRDLHSVASQAAPDGRFPTVSFPNPEEPAAMARVLALGAEVKADLILANDPDADRLAVAALDSSGKPVVLSGNEIGVLLGHHVLNKETNGTPDRLVVTTVVSSPQLAEIARAFQVRYAEVLTGFKWIAGRAVDAEEREGARFVFGYEEALGYTVGSVTRDKDGIGAALVMAELAASLKARGQTILDRLREIRERHGLYVSRQKSLTLPGREGAERIRSIMAALRQRPIQALGGVTVSSTWDLQSQRRLHSDGRVESVETLPAADVLSYRLQDGGRIAVRPSGTEPKVKIYFDVVERLAPGESLDIATGRGQARIDALERAILGEMGVS
ncbi:MAG: phospho-sugar mutase [Myxococcota bacterium]